MCCTGLEWENFFRDVLMKENCSEWGRVSTANAELKGHFLMSKETCSRVFTKANDKRDCNPLLSWGLRIGIVLFVLLK